MSKTSRSTREMSDPSTRPYRPGVVDADGLRERLAAEVERCARTRRSFSLVVLLLGEAGANRAEEIGHVLRRCVRKMDVVGHTRPREYAVIMPETDSRASIPARRILEAVAPLAPEARVGIAVCPVDAADDVSVLAGAREAAAQAGAGESLSLMECRTTVTAGQWSLVAVDPAMRSLLGLVRRLAPTELPVLLQGDTGVGKEVFAETLHQWSRRRGGPLVTINCAAVAETLFESELFGHVRGAFTGATEGKPGLLESAAGGTVLLDEIGECPPALQSKLLRVLETRRVCRVGSVTERPIDIRIIAATNRDLEVEVARGAFRRDLFYRLNTAVVRIPALRDRPLDIPVLATTLLADACERLGRQTLTLSPEAIRRLSLHDWPGNVRELRNLMELCVATVAAERVEARDLPDHIAGTTAPWLARADETPAPAEAATDPGRLADRPFANLKEELRHLERTRIVQALEATGGVRNQAARLLGMPLRTFVTRLREYDIAPGRPGRRKDPAQ